MSAIMTSRQASELDHAFERNGWRAEDVKELSRGETLKSILAVIRGQGRIVFDITTTDEEWWQEAGVRYFPNNFRAQFVDREIPATDGVPLTHAPLGRDMTGTEIVTHLGGEAAAVITAQDLKRFMNENRNHERSIAVLVGADGELWVVRFYWNACGGWDVGAFPVAGLYRLHAGARALSRK